MGDFMRAGGWVMWLVLALSMASLAVGVWFSRKPDERKLGMLRSLSTATVFAMLGGILTNTSTTLWRVAQKPEWGKSEDMPLIVMTGLSESLTPGILGFMILAMAWLFAATGYRRAGSQGEFL